jgi:hypothetical protein
LSSVMPGSPVFILEAFDDPSDHHPVEFNEVHE